MPFSAIVSKLFKVYDFMIHLSLPCISVLSLEGHFWFTILEFNECYVCLQLLESNVVIRCRESDQSLLSGLLNSITQKYKEATKRDLNLQIDTDVFLPAGSAGGVELLAMKGRIKVSNTLEARLELISSQLLPEIRMALFGRNPNRKFND